MVMLSIKNRLRHLRFGLVISALFFASLVIACTSTPLQICNGNVITPQNGLTPTEDHTLLNLALGAPGKGGLCTGQVFVVNEPVRAYRVWDASKNYSLQGHWWSFQQPQGPREQYAANNDICPEWSALDMVTECFIQTGTKVVVGPGQSAQCQSIFLEASPINQVYIPSGKDNQIQIEHCGPSTPWPMDTSK
jgi:hypothetical protein